MIWTIWHWVAQGRRRRTDERTRLLDYTPGECANSRPKCQPAKPTVHISPKNVIKVALLMWIIWNWAAQDERRRTRRRILPKATTKLILLEVLQKFCWEMSKMTQRYPYSGSLFPFQNTKISTMIGGIIVSYAEFCCCNRGMGVIRTYEINGRIEVLDIHLQNTWWSYR